MEGVAGDMTGRKDRAIALSFTQLLMHIAICGGRTVPSRAVGKLRRCVVALIDVSPFRGLDALQGEETDRRCSPFSCAA